MHVVERLTAQHISAFAHSVQIVRRDSSDKVLALHVKVNFLRREPHGTLEVICQRLRRLIHAGFRRAPAAIC